ncbi:MAG: YsnF/AvaK domain-containing protein [Ktedonobacteraceae bacterium]|nr:YsnF/AvaK domain-containing protein [Ktedonobacteraceae bacterium]
MSRGTAGTYDNTTTTGAYNTNAAYADNRADVTDQDRRSVQLREEQLQAEKQRVQAGEVRLHKDVVTEQRNIDVPVTHEEVYVEQHAVNPQVSNAPIGQEEAIRVPVSEEQVNVTKNTVTTGEVEIGKRAVTENQRVSDTVRREEARIERDGDARIRTNDAIDPDTRGNV